MQERINLAKGEASATEAHALASAKAVTLVAEALRGAGGAEASSLRVAEQYVSAFKALAASGSTVVVPANTGDVGAMVAQAMAIYRQQGGLGSSSPSGAPPADVADVSRHSMFDSEESIESEGEADAATADARSAADDGRASPGQ